MIDYQELLGRIADAAGITGSPTLDEVIDAIQRVRAKAEECTRSSDTSASCAGYDILEEFTIRRQA